MADNEVKEVSLRQSIFLSTLQYLKIIIDDQKEQIDFLNANIKVNYERIDDFKEEKDNLLEEIDTLMKIPLANRDLANAHEAKSNVHEAKTNLFLSELKALRTDKLLLTSKVEILSKSLSESQS